MDLLTKRVLGGGLVLVCVAATALAARGMRRPPAESAPAYRQKGAESAKITIVEFSDFQCPACRVAEEPAKQLIALYEKDTRFIFKQFPLERVHRNARAAAVAAECMGRQGKFWPFHDALYTRQEEWGELEDARAALARYEKELGADLDALKTCEQDPTVAAAIEADKKEAKDRWVQATPTFFINGRRFVGKVQLSSRAPNWIEKELKR